MYAAKGHVFKADTDRTAIVTAPLNLPLYSALPVTSINLQDILIALGGQAAFLGAVARLAKSLVSHRLAREAEEFKIKLKADADPEIERLKSSHQIVATEHQGAVHKTP
jgi:hypothetical protein